MGEGQTLRRRSLLTAAAGTAAAAAARARSTSPGSSAVSRTSTITTTSSSATRCRTPSTPQRWATSTCGRCAQSEPGRRDADMRKSLTAAGLTLLLLVLPSMAAGQTPPTADRFQKVVLDDTPGEPMNLAVLPDLRVLHTTRPGELRIYNPRNGLNTVAATFDVYKHDEEGLQSVAIDPDFEDNHWV